MSQPGVASRLVGPAHCPCSRLVIYTGIQLVSSFVASSVLTALDIVDLLAGAFGGDVNPSVIAAPYVTLFLGVRRRLFGLLVIF